jgi:hypothetical protein
MSAGDGTSGEVLSVNCPGGIARQFRVQIWNGETPSHWKLVGSFQDLSEASACAEKLMLAGEQTRVVACRTLPTAA